MNRVKWGQLLLLLGISPALFAADLRLLCKTSTRENFSAIPQPYVSTYSWGPYLNSLQPTAELRRKSLDQALAAVDLETLRTTATNGPVTPSQANAALFHDRALSQLPSCFQTNEIARAAQKAPLACPIYDLECRQVIKTIFNELAPCFAGSGYVSLYNEVYRLGSDPILAQATAKLALRTLDHVKTIESKRTFEANLYDDTVQSLQEAGASQKDFERDAMLILGLYGTRGAAMEPFLLANLLSIPENQPTFAALGVVASAVAYLDAVTVQTKHVYSLPASVQTECDYTRPYHFWLPAYLAYFLKQKGFHDLSIARAVHLVTTGYETMSSISTKNPYLAFTADYYRLETQKNMAFDEAGIAWAVIHSENRHREIRVDHYLESIIASSQNPHTEKTIDTFKPVLKKLSTILDTNLEYLLKWRNAIGTEGATACVEDDLSYAR